MNITSKPVHAKLTRQRQERAAVIAEHGSLLAAWHNRRLLPPVDLTLSEALVLGLLHQEVKVYFSVFGHGCTEVGEVLRVYQEAGLLKVYGVRSEIEASHAAAALRWATGQKAAVITSIGPGALQALAASLAPASDGIGVWYLFGDETTEDEGYNMQQVPRPEQASFLKLASTMGSAYSLHTPLALVTALQRGAAVVDHPYRPGPFYLLLPMNTQGTWVRNFNLLSLPEAPALQMAAAEGDYARAVEWIGDAERVVVKAGGGARGAGKQLAELVERAGAVLVHTPIAAGCLPYDHPRNMGVGGSKGSLSGNYAMEHADLLIAVGTRAVCQSDSSRTGYPRVQRVININLDLHDAQHYNKTLALVGDVSRTLERLNQALVDTPPSASTRVRINGKAESTGTQGWLAACAQKKTDWQAMKAERLANPVLYDEYWGRAVLTQPAAIKTAHDWARANGVISFFDAGDVQANGFQVAEDEHPRQTFTESGASYMGFAVSALLATAAARPSFYGLAFTGDGSFTMNPQVLIDGVEHGAQGCILLLDNGRMGAITGLQEAQYGAGFATWNRMQVDYLAWAQAVPGVLALNGGGSLETLTEVLHQARQHTGLSLVHVPVYFGPDPMGSMGVYGRWNVGNWCDEVQELRHQIGL